MSNKHRHWQVGLAIMMIAACGKKQAPVQPGPTSSNTQAPPARPALGPRGPTDNSQAERERLERERLAREAADRETMMHTLEAPVHFSYDRSDLSEASRILLDAKTKVLAAHPGIRLRIVGHTDSRGSDEYNQALGQRRAAAAHRYFVQRGIVDGRLDYVSMGEDRPLCPETTEACWAENRRDEFEIVYQ